MDAKEIIWGLVALLGYGIAIAQSLRIKSLQRELLQATFQKIVPIKQDIEKLEKENKVNLQHIKLKKAELTVLEHELKQTENKEMTLNDALKILEI